jgi:hypothetical protein
MLHHSTTFTYQTSSYVMPGRAPTKWVMQSTSVEDLNAREREAEYFERMALEEATQRALTSVTRCYTTFCTSIGVDPWPLSYRSLSLHLVQYCHRFGHTTRSIPSILSHLKRANRPHVLAEPDVMRLEDLVAGLKKFDRSAPARKLPMTARVLDAVQLAADMANPVHYQHLTMSRVAHDALLRGKELSKLRRCDINWSRDRKSVVVKIHLSKANKHGLHEEVKLSDYGSTSAVAFLRVYFFEVMGWTESGTDISLPLWPTVTPSGRVTKTRAVTKDEFVTLARRLLTKAGYPAESYSGHSYRSGGATDLWDSHRCRALTIKLHGRWKSDAYRLYIRDNPDRTADEVSSALRFFAAASLEDPPSTAGAPTAHGTAHRT